MSRLPFVLLLLSALPVFAVTPVGLRCEAQVDPVGIGEPKPHLSWRLDEGRQTAYQIMVDGLWDSGRVESADTANIEYAGAPLTSLARCTWKVRVWDGDNKASDWSAPATWTMGLLSPADWKAEWIGFDAARNAPLPEARFDGAKWLGHGEDPPMNAPAGHRLFRSILTLPAGAEIEKGELMVAADNGSKFVLNTQLVASTGKWEDPAVADITRNLRAGANDLRVELNNAEAGPAGLLARIVVTLKDGTKISHVTDASWTSLATPGSNWHNRDLDAEPWAPVRVLGDYGMKPWGTLKAANVLLPSPSHLRTSFTAAKPVRRATLVATALGITDLHLNGVRVSEDFFTPGWTDYNRRVYSRVYDVTSRVKTGENVLGAVLADGWYSGYVGYGRKRDHYGRLLRLRAQLHLEYADGTKDIVATGPSWKAAKGGTQEADFLMGEVFDAQKAPTGWDAPDFDASAWSPVVVGGNEVNPVVETHPGPPVRVVSEFRAKTITSPKPGVHVLDLGQNFAGVVRLTVAGKPGQIITLRYAERLNPDGTIYTTNLRSARTIDTYTCKGGGVETWVPRFTFHGYQYVEVTGLDAPPTPETVVGLALSSDTPIAGAFECSDPMLNQLHNNIVWTQRANFIDIPTDCPQRDERLGWTGDAQIYIRTATLNSDVQAFFTKWLVDLCVDGQRADGQFPMVAPVKVAGDDGGPAWADAGVICPWTIYEVYGDRRVLERHYDAMKRFISFCEKRCTPDLLPPAKFHCFGDWLSIKADTPKDVIYTAYFAYSTHLVARAAEVLGRKDDAAHYTQLFERIRETFNRAYVGADGRIKGNTQAVYVLAIAFDLVQGEKAALAAKYLVEDIESRDNHLSTGFIGTKDLMLALAKAGRNDVAYRLLHNDTFPSWGFSIKHGATSIWERWNGWTPEQGFGDPGMNSFAHYSFGAVYQWMVENICGIHNAGDAYRRIHIAPQPGGKLTWAKTRFDSIHGPIESNWRVADGRLTLDIAIPANTTATVMVPGEKGAPREVGPGRHTFSAAYP